MIKNLPKKRLQQIVNFIVDNYDTAPEYLYPKTVEELLFRDGNNDIVIMEDDHGIECLTFIKQITEYLSETYRTIVRMDCRGLGVSKKLDSTVESILKNKGVKKNKCHIFVNNYPSLFRRLKTGYLIEGLLKNHDEPGLHEYILGKEL